MMYEADWDYTLELTQKVDDSVVGRLLRGAYDMHVHIEPEPWMTRRYDTLDTALHAREMGLAGFVAKNRAYCTQAVALMVNRLVPDMRVYGSITLDGEVGGLNYRAVLAAADMGTKVLWMPVFFSANSMHVVERNFGLSLGDSPITILDDAGRLLPVVVDILGVAKDNDMVVCTGHISPLEVDALANKCMQMGVSKLVVTHPLSTIVFEEALTSGQTVALAKAGFTIEHCAQTISPTGDRIDPAVVADAIRMVGADNCIMTTDFGGTPHPAIGEGLRMFIGALLKRGLTEQEIEGMVKTTPRRLLSVAEED
ncbi:MAG: hypothetical protein JW846_05900 [Dehalococcoidia bacterium]|nr:hypothetical protein [Dehalococcoidia bacterium]